MSSVFTLTYLMQKGTTSQPRMKVNKALSEYFTYLLQQLLHTLLLDGFTVTHCYQLPPRVVPMCDSF